VGTVADSWLVSGASNAIDCQTIDSVLTVTLTRPDKGNALRQEDALELAERLGAIDGAGEVRAVLIRAEGKHFCVGADLVTANADGPKPTVGHLRRSLESGPHRLIAEVWNCPVPTVSAVRGRAMGLGLHLAIACDFTLAAEDALFTEPFCSRGFSVDSGGSYLLPNLVGVRRARQMLLRGRTIDAATAADWGLVDEVEPVEVLDRAAVELAAELAAGPTFSLGHTKELLNRKAPESLDAALSAEAQSVEATVRSADFKEGLRAFEERRDPVFGGH
jgi:2-(1,2-epoxy-1,2-dihydrophenyl)acetyl-CoA isomerase